MPLEPGAIPQGSNGFQQEQNGGGAPRPQADLAAEVGARPPIILRISRERMRLAAESQARREEDLLDEQIRLAALRENGAIAE